MSAGSILTTLVLDLIEKLRGKASDATARKVAEAVTSKVEESVIATIRIELRQFEALLGITLALDALAEGAQGVVEEMRRAELRGRMRALEAEGAATPEPIPVPVGDREVWAAAYIAVLLSSEYPVGFHDAAGMVEGTEERRAIARAAADKAVAALRRERVAELDHQPAKASPIGDDFG